MIEVSKPAPKAPEQPFQVPSHLLAKYAALLWLALLCFGMPCCALPHLTLFCVACGQEGCVHRQDHG